MATNSWDETKPLGTDLISAGDDSVRQLKLDLRERIDAAHVYRTGNEVAKTDSGTTTGGTGLTLIDTGKSWTVNEWVGATARLTGGVGENQVREVVSNTATQLTLDRAWTTNPSSSGYRVDLYAVGTHRHGVGRVLFGIDADKPTTYVLGRWWWSTDTERMYYDNGVTWVSVDPVDYLKKHSSESRLTMVRGRVSSAGAILQGTGFTSGRNSTGNYTVTITTTFGSIPAVVVTAEDINIAVGLNNLAAGSFDVDLADTASVSRDADFCFIAIGPV